MRYHLLLILSVIVCACETFDSVRIQNLFRQKCIPDNINPYNTPHPLAFWRKMYYNIGYISYSRSPEVIMFKLFKWCFSHSVRALLTLAAILSVLLLLPFLPIFNGLWLLLIVPLAFLIAFLVMKFWTKSISKHAYKAFEQGYTDMMHDYTLLLYKKAHYTAEGPAAAIRYVTVLLERGEYEKALRILDRYTENKYEALDDTIRLSYYNNRTQALLKSDRSAEAAEVFDRMTDLLAAYDSPVTDAMKAAFTMTEAELRLQQGDAEKAFALIQTLDNTGTPRRVMQYHLLLGKILLALEKPEEAAKEFTLVIENGKEETRRTAQRLMQV